MKFTAALLVAAHAAAKTNTASLAYRQRLSIALKAAFAAAKAPVMEVVLVKVSWGKVSCPASYNQFGALCQLGALGLGLGEGLLNGSQFTKRVDVAQASEAISLLHAGQQVRFVA